LQTRKEGANKGRMFYRCGTDVNCGFFEWADDAVPAGNPRAPPAQPTQYNNTHAQPTQHTGNARAPLAQHNGNQRAPATQHHAPTAATIDEFDDDQPMCPCGERANMQMQKTGQRKVSLVQRRPTHPDFQGQVYYICAFGNMRNPPRPPCSFMRWG